MAVMTRNILLTHQACCFKENLEKKRTLKERTLALSLSTSRGSYISLSDLKSFDRMTLKLEARASKTSDDLLLHGYFIQMWQEADKLDKAT